MPHQRDTVVRRSHGGEIEIGSTLGKGTTIRLVIPRPEQGEAGREEVLAPHALGVDGPGGGVSPWCPVTSPPAGVAAPLRS